MTQALYAYMNNKKKEIMLRKIFSAINY
jgi:hypothetical protein